MAIIKRHQALRNLGKWPRLIELLKGENSLAAWARRYLEHAEMLGISARTLESRYGDLQLFIRWCDERALTEPQEIKKEHVERYQRYVFHYRKKDGLPLSLNRQAILLIHLKGWFRWLAKHNHIEFNPASEIECPKPPTRQLRQPLSLEEVEKLLSLPDTETTLGLRNRAMLEVLFSSGLRRAELIKLQVFDVDFYQGVVMVKQGKGRKDRLLPISQRALHWLQKYLDQSRTQLLKSKDEVHLFLSAWGTHLTSDYFGTLVRDYLNQAEIHQVGACHLLRHSMATQMLDRGADIRFIQEMLGHAKLSTTQLYTHVAVGKLKEVHAATHPLTQNLKHLEVKDAED